MSGAFFGWFAVSLRVQPKERYRELALLVRCFDDWFVFFCDFHTIVLKKHLIAVSASSALSAGQRDMRTATRACGGSGKKQKQKPVVVVTVVVTVAIEPAVE